MSASSATRRASSTSSRRTRGNGRPRDRLRPVPGVASVLGSRSSFYARGGERERRREIRQDRGARRRERGRARAEPGIETTPRIPLAPDEPTTLVEIFEYVARVHRRSDTLNYKRDGRWVAISSDEMLRRVRSIAGGLYSLGVRSGDRVFTENPDAAQQVTYGAGDEAKGLSDRCSALTLFSPLQNNLTQRQRSRMWHEQSSLQEEFHREAHGTLSFSLRRGKTS